MKSKPRIALAAALAIALALVSAKANAIVIDLQPNPSSVWYDYNQDGYAFSCPSYQCANPLGFAWAGFYNADGSNGDIMTYSPYTRVSLQNILAAPFTFVSIGLADYRLPTQAQSVAFQFTHTDGTSNVRAVSLTAGVLGLQSFLFNEQNVIRVDMFSNSFTLFQFDNINVGAQVSETPLPAALQLFATGLGLLGLLAWRRKWIGAPAVAA